MQEACLVDICLNFPQNFVLKISARAENVALVLMFLTQLILHF